MRHFLRNVAAAVLATSVALAAPSASATTSPVEVVESPQGTEAWLRRDSSLPIVSLAFRFTGGAALDAPGKEGLAQFMAALLDEGAGPYDAVAFRDRLDDRAIRLSFSAGRDSLFGTLHTLRENVEEAATLLGHALARPRFDDEPVGRIRSQLEAVRAQNETRPGSVGRTRWFSLVFGDGPYGRPSSGTQASLAGINVEDLRAAASERLVRQRLVVGVAGDIDRETLARVLDLAFGDLPAGALPDEAPENGNFAGQAVHVPMDIPQTELVFGLPGVARDDADFFPAFVLNSVLGGGTPGTRLEQEVRIKRGLAYSIYTYLADAERAPILIGATSTRDEGAGETVAVVRDVVRRTAAGGLTAGELADAKLYITGSFPLALDSTSEIAGFLVAMQTNDLGIDYLDRRNALVEAVTIEDVQRVAKRLLVEDAMVWVAVGRSNPFP